MTEDRMSTSNRVTLNAVGERWKSMMLVKNWCWYSKHAHLIWASYIWTSWNLHPKQVYGREIWILSPSEDIQTAPWRYTCVLGECKGTLVSGRITVYNMIPLSVSLSGWSIRSICQWLLCAVIKVKDTFALYWIRKHHAIVHLWKMIAVNNKCITPPTMYMLQCLISFLTRASQNHLHC